MGAQWKAKGKALAADAKGKLFTKLVREITVAARAGGTDPTTNSHLRMAVDAARKASMPKDTLDRAIKKGAGAGADAVNYATVLFEGYAPHRVPVMVECLTDNPNRTAPNMRVCFRKGQLTAVAWDFDRVGLIEGEAENGADVELAAIEAGAQDFEPAEDEGVTLFITEPSDVDSVSKALPEQGIKVLSAKIGYKAKTPISMSSLSAEAQEEVQDFLAGIENDDDVQNVYVGLVD